MKSPRLEACLLMLSYILVESALAQSVPEPKLKGIVCLEDRTLALLEMGGSPRFPDTSLLRPGDAMHGYEVVAIDEKAAHVTLRDNKSQRIMDLKLDLAAGEEVTQRTLHFQSTRLSSVLEIYQEVCQCTVIRWSALTEAFLDLKSGPSLSTGQAVETLNDALAGKDVIMKPRGDKFVFAVPNNQVAVLASIPAPPVAEVGSTQEVLPPGLMKFGSADLLQVLAIYADLSGRTVLQPTSLSRGKLTVRSQTSLTQKEAIWLMDAVLRLADVVMVSESDKFVFALPPYWTNNLPRFDPKAAAAKIRKPTAPAPMKFQHADGVKLLETYAALLGRQPLPIQPTISAVKFSLRTPSALNQEETIFALEALAAVNNLRFELVGDDQVELLPAALSRK